MEKHEKVEMVHVEWLKQKQTAHLLDDSIIPKERQKTLQEENITQKLNVQFKSPGAWIERGKCCGTVDKKESKWIFLPHKSKSNSSSSSSSREDTIHPQLMPKYMPKDTLNATDCGLFYKHFLIQCTH